jgi:hypothetical protein
MSRGNAPYKLLSFFLSALLVYQVAAENIPFVLGTTGRSTVHQQALAPESITRKISPEEVETMMRLAQKRRAPGVFNSGLQGFYSESVPVRKSGYDKSVADFHSPVLQDIVSGHIEEQKGKGVMVIERENERGFWDSRKQLLVLKLYKLLQQNANLAFREFLKEVRFRITANNNNILSVYRNPNGLYEIAIDKALFELGDLDIFPFMVLVLNHEFSHPQLHEEISGKAYGPLMREMSSLLTDADLFANWKPHHRRSAVEVMDALKERGYVTDPYKKFLAGPYATVKDKIRQAYLLATNPEVNPVLARRIAALTAETDLYNRHRIPLDFEAAIDTYAGPLPAGKAVSVQEYAEVLNRMFLQLRGVIQDVVIQDLKKYLEPYYLAVSAEEKKKRVELLVGRVIPAMTAIGGDVIRRELERVLAVSNYDISVKCAAARALLVVSSYRSMPMISNPFLAREIVSCLQKLRGSPDFGVSAVVAEDVNFKLMLLGKTRISNPQLYRDIRSEIMWWRLYAQDIAGRHAFGNEEPAITSEEYAYIRNTVKSALESLGDIRETLKCYLGVSTVPKREWKEKNRYLDIADDPLNWSERDMSRVVEVKKEFYFSKDQDAQREIRETVKTSKQLKRALMSLLEDSYFVRESLFVINGVVVTENAVEAVEISYFAKGTQKVNYLATVRTKDGEEYRFLINMVNPRIFTGDVYKDAEKEGKIEREIQYLQLFGSPHVENFGGEWKQQDLVFWSEELLDGVPLRDYLAAHAARGEDAEFKGVWKQTLRKHAEIQFGLYERSARKVANNDCNPLNSNWKEGVGRINDIGDHMAQANLARFIMILCGRTLDLEKEFPELAGTADIADICDGILDALGERTGTELLRTFAEGDENPMLVSPITFRGQDIRAAVKGYLGDGVFRYFPPSISTGPTVSEVERARKYLSDSYMRQLSSIMYISRDLEKLKESPWIWLYLNMKQLELRGGNARLYRAAAELYRYARANPATWQPEETEGLVRHADEVAQRYGLDVREKEVLRTFISYERTLADLSKRIILFHVSKPDARELGAEIDRLSELISKTAVDPAGAYRLYAEIAHDEESSKRMRLLFQRILHAEVMPPELDVHCTLFGILEQFAEFGLVSHASVVALLREMPVSELIRITQYDIQYKYPELLEGLIDRDYKRFADLLNGLSRHDVAMLIPQLAYKLFPAQSFTIEETAYIFNELNPSIIDELLFAMTIARNRSAEWGERWQAWVRGRQTSAAEYENVVLPRIEKLLAEIAALDFNKATKIVCGMFAGLQAEYIAGRSFLGKEEVITPDGTWRYNDLILLLSRLPRELVLNAFRRTYQDNGDKIAIFLNMVRAAGYEKEFDRVKAILDSDERLNGYYEKTMLQQDRMKKKSLDEETAQITDTAA